MLPSSSSNLGSGSGTFNLREIEYIAEEQLIRVTPAFSHDGTIRLGDGGVYGPFVVDVPCYLPLHVAFTLKKTRKCRITQPDWFTVENLQQLCLQEQQEPERLAEVQSSYLEIGNLLLNFARDDLDNADALREKMNSLELLRQTKLFNKIRQLDTDSVVLRLDNATPMEVQWVRDTLFVTLKGFDSIRNVNKSM